MAAAATTTTKLLLSDRASTLKNVPSDYIRPISDRPNLTDQAHISEGSIPLIDLQGFYGLRRSDITKQIGQACQNGGFFQVIYTYIATYNPSLEWMITSLKMHNH